MPKVRVKSKSTDVFTKTGGVSIREDQGEEVRRVVLSLLSSHKEIIKLLGIDVRERRKEKLVASEVAGLVRDFKKEAKGLLGQVGDFFSGKKHRKGTFAKRAESAFQSWTKVRGAIDEDYAPEETLKEAIAKKAERFDLFLSNAFAEVFAGVGSPFRERGMFGKVLKGAKLASALASGIFGKAGRKRRKREEVSEGEPVEAVGGGGEKMEVGLLEAGEVKILNRDLLDILEEMPELIGKEFEKIERKRQSELDDLRFQVQGKGGLVGEGGRGKKGEKGEENLLDELGKEVAGEGIGRLVFGGALGAGVTGFLAKFSKRLLPKLKAWLKSGAKLGVKGGWKLAKGGLIGLIADQVFERIYPIVQNYMETEDPETGESKADWWEKQLLGGKEGEEAIAFALRDMEERQEPVRPKLEKFKSARVPPKKVVEFARRAMGLGGLGALQSKALGSESEGVIFPMVPLKGESEERRVARLMAESLYGPAKPVEIREKSRGLTEKSVRETERVFQAPQSSPMPPMPMVPQSPRVSPASPTVSPTIEVQPQVGDIGLLLMNNFVLE